MKEKKKKEKEREKGTEREEREKKHTPGIVFTLTDFPSTWMFRCRKRVTPPSGIDLR